MIKFSCLIEYKSINRYISFSCKSKEIFIATIRKQLNLKPNANGQYPYQIREIKVM